MTRAYIAPGSLLLVTTLCAVPVSQARAAHLAMGLRVGEVRQDSAIVWTRVTKEAQRNWDGYREPQKRQRKQDDYAASPVAVSDRHGAVPGSDGEVRLLYARNRALLNGWYTPWEAVEQERDYVHQFVLDDLSPATRYYVRVQARDGEAKPISATADGTFRTPARADQWQDVRFAVVTGQSYWDLDDPKGFHMYPAMQKLGLDFIIPTGDTVYLDSEAPRARTVALARFHWHRMYSLPRLVEFHRSVPGYWEKDDHDAWCDDCWPALKAPWMNPLTFPEGLAVFREQVPMGQSTCRTIRWGKGLQIWLVEGRDFRSANDAPDGPGKSIWGEQQRAWLKRTILQSDADFRVLISPTPIVGPDRPTKADNHSNAAFAWEGNHFRNWTKERGLKNFYVCCGDRHWQYLSIDPATQLHEFSCGPASDEHAGGTPGHDPKVQPFHRVKGGFLSVSVTRPGEVPTIALRHHDVHGNVVNEFVAGGK